MIIKHIFGLALAHLSLVLVAFALLALQPVTATAAPKKTPAKQDLTDIKARINALKQELNKSQVAQKDAADELKESEQAISVTNKKLHDINQQQNRNQQILVKLNAQSGALQDTLTKQQALLGQQLYQQYLHSQQSYMQLMLQDARPSILARDVHYYRYVATARATLIQEMQTNLTKVEKLNAQTERTLNETAALKQKQLAERVTLEQEKASKAKMVKSLSSKIAAQRNEIKKLTRDEKRLTQLFERLAKIVPPAPKPAKKGAGSASQSAASTSQKTVVSTNNTLPTNEFSGVKFSTLKGKLKLPVRGNIVNRYGSNREDSGISWKGLFITANEGDEVRSVAEGRVVFSDWLRGFGNLVIVDHGGGYMSLYGNNQATLKQVGDNVSAGDTIASVGNSGGNETHGLYYELRSQSKPFDPLSWSIVR